MSWQMMDSVAGSFRHPVRALGPVAAEQMAESLAGQVAAVFRSTFYISFVGRHSENLYVCLGHVAMQPGPLNCITTAPAGVDWRASGVRAGMKAVIAGATIKVGNILEFPLPRSLRRAAAQPVPVWQAPPDPVRLSRGIAAFRQAASERDDICGLGLFLRPAFQPAPHHHACLAAQPRIDDARRWLTSSFRAPGVSKPYPGWIEKLSGLGPGLTPSGDDFLGGIMVALNTLGENRVNKFLWPEIRRHVRNNSNALSLAHLSAAAKGLQCAAVDRALLAVLTGGLDKIELAAAGMAEIGHSSGWDIMAGVITTFEAWLQCSTSNQLQPDLY